MCCDDQLNSQDILSRCTNTHQYIFDMLVAKNADPDFIFHMDGSNVRKICESIKSPDRQKRYIKGLREVILKTPVLLISNFDRLGPCNGFYSILVAKSKLTAVDRNHDLFWGTKYKISDVFLGNKKFPELKELLIQKKHHPVLINNSQISDTRSLNDDTKRSQESGGLDSKSNTDTLKGVKMDEKPRKKVSRDKSRKPEKDTIQDSPDLAKLFKDLGDTFVQSNKQSTAPITGLRDDIIKVTTSFEKQFTSARKSAVRDRKAITDNIKNIEKLVTAVDDKTDAIELKTEAIETKTVAIETKTAAIETKTTAIENHVLAVEKSNKRNFWYSLGAAATFAIAAGAHSYISNSKHSDLHEQVMTKSEMQSITEAFEDGRARDVAAKQRDEILLKEFKELQKPQVSPKPDMPR